MSEYRPSKPSNPRDDWKLWLVVNPGTWLMPILMAVLVVALAVHAFIYSNDNYNPLTFDASSESIIEEAVE
ncbi:MULTISPECIES: light-harvesting antenna LH1, alpha subunit [Ectothiorhodospira]|uniref:Light-harvesting protein B-800-850 alpha chain n=1 Tax=Ectothiorhodospira marina TaxID=1396821 RepID=A0A1H7J293_9GAMM|nr:MULTISPECIES: light-harvesting antenna LH1, alpha subunit [Ectothiorhodospira]MCG5515504.1 light-harvesting protein [Ectothiorhodospira sp. 9100]MCG5518123.1 light-harvesting protein [Ectothiorhodospira sp. 9905]SEK68554.1 light-harvesting protein B-800-850 alpha chain [Ectothiorhodospira marina]